MASKFDTLSRIFQSTFPRGERRYHSIPVFDIKNISIHVPAWGTTQNISSMSTIRVISIHVPAWGTTIVESLLCPMVKFQSTFPRGERQAARLDWEYDSGISIHVPAWGTTVQYKITCVNADISIHVPAWGTTMHSHLSLF